MVSKLTSLMLVIGMPFFGARTNLIAETAPDPLVQQKWEYQLAEQIAIKKCPVKDVRLMRGLDSVDSNMFYLPRGEAHITYSGGLIEKTWNETDQLGRRTGIDMANDINYRLHLTPPFSVSIDSGLNDPEVDIFKLVFKHWNVYAGARIGGIISGGSDQHNRKGDSYNNSNDSRNSSGAIGIGGAAKF